jgi:hypothetical protein
LRLQEIFDVPEEIANGPQSAAFRDFLWNWFGDTRAVVNGELDLTFLKELSAEELGIARDLIRRNLKLRYVHIIEGASALDDIEAAPILRRMITDEPEESRRLTIAGALWKLVKDPVFLTCLECAKANKGPLLVGRHLLQVLWLDDERAVDFLIDLLDHKDSFVRSSALGKLNQLEFGRRMGIPAREMPSQPGDYRKRRNDSAFRENMVAAVRKWNRSMNYGRWQPKGEMGAA